MSRVRTAEARSTRPPVPLAVYLALAAVPLALWEGWALVAWLADDPHQITQYRTGRTFNWYAAHIFEALCVLLAVVVLILVARDCRRQRRILTFDVLFILACVHIWWLTTAFNGYMPIWLPSSNFVNVNDVCGHIPFIVNPDCGRIPNPILVTTLPETFGPLALAMVAEAGVRRTRARWPEMTTRQLVARVILLAVVIALIFEGLVVVGLKLWTYAAPSWMSIPWGRGFFFPAAALITSGVWMGLVACLRVFKDDHGQTFVERGLQRFTPRLRTLLTFAALYASIQLLTWIVGNAPIMLIGPYARQSNFTNLPAHVLNGVCDPDGGHTTRYGPCPGTPGFKIPGRHSLPGRSP